VVEPNEAFGEMLSAFPAEVQAVAHRLREVILSLHPDAHEVVWRVERSAGYGLGPRKMQDQYAYLRPHARHVNLGFMRGAVLPDPEGLLQGTGKALRHVKVRDPGEAEHPALRALLEAARLERQTALAEQRGPAPSRRSGGPVS
jgi:hypothetical protein